MKNDRNDKMHRMQTPKRLHKNDRHRILRQEKNIHPIKDAMQPRSEKMKLITKKLEKLFSKYPPMSQSEEENPLAIAKYFISSGRGTWYVLEAEKMGEDDYHFFGYVKSPMDPLFDEYGSFTLKELESIKIPIQIGDILIGNIEIERDLYFEPTRMSEIIGE